jgi:diguanylate cyclase (GGDEF)-like protein
LTATADNFHWIELSIDSSYLLMVGATTETLLLALALAASYSMQRRKASISRDESTENKRHTMQVQDEMFQLQKQAQMDLENEVKARTQEFEEALSGLSLVNNELKGLSETDSLTGLTNRRLFEQNIEAEAARSRRERKPLAIALLDIDHFKSVNDNFGHQCGDDSLIAFADTLKRTVKRPGDLLSRYGGEEFVVMLPNTTIEGATVLLEKVRLATEAMIVETQGNKISFTVSIGLTARVVGNDEDAAKMVAFADKLLYQAKEAGRNCIKSGNI